MTSVLDTSTAESQLEGVVLRGGSQQRSLKYSKFEILFESFYQLIIARLIFCCKLYGAILFLLQPDLLITSK